MKTLDFVDVSVPNNPPAGYTGSCGQAWPRELCKRMKIDVVYCMTEIIDCVLVSVLGQLMKKRHGLPTTIKASSRSETRLRCGMKPIII